MKRLFALLVSVALILILWMEYLEYRRHRADGAYAFPVDTTIDWSYHNPELVTRYLLTAEEVGHYGRYCWAELGIDVETDSPLDPDKKTHIRTYQQLRASAKQLEMTLKASARLKSQGLSEAEVQQQLEPEPSPRDRVTNLLDNPVLARPGDKGALVYEIQRRLIERQFNIPLDGIYRVETQRSIQTFQEQHQLYPSGEVDRRTLEKLFESSSREVGTSSRS